MKIALLSGAVKNAGDYLIVSRSKDLLKQIYPDCILDEYNRLVPLDEKLGDINKHDVLVFAGGPGYLPNCYPNHMPLVNDLDSIKIPMFFLGMGWYAPDSTEHTQYNYHFTDMTQKLIERVRNDSEYLGCRDWYTVNMLRNNGFESGVMTGCPAWYDIEYVNCLSLLKNPIKELRKICISDPADDRDFSLAIQIAEYIKRTFSEAKIIFVNHRGCKTTPAGQLLTQALNLLNIEQTDISSNSEEIKIYDDCDMHIGFRVHAHIYNLSRRNASILIEEDGRGAGVNDALGLSSIRAYIISKDGTRVCTPYIEKLLDDYLNRLWNTNFTVYNRVFSAMNESYGRMKEHLNIIQNII